MNRFDERKTKVPVIAYEVNGGNIVCSSINQMAQYFKDIGVKGINPEQIARKIVDGGILAYTETFYLDGKLITQKHEFFFDELADGLTSAINGKGLVLKNKSGGKK